MRRTVLSALVAVVALGVAALGAPAVQAAPPPAYQPPPVPWGPCSEPRLAGKAECGFVTAPLDYAQPGGAKIKIAVSRVKHTVADAKAQGPMLVNPGGPGGSGLVLALLGGAVPKHAGDAYDWIGFDPRGVGASTPALSCIPDYGGYDRPEYDPTKAPGVISAWQARAERYAAACASKGGALLSHLTTADAARDLDTIRKALGAKQINYYGFSYGTYLGQVYATLYPQNLRRAVFDGVVDHRGVWYEDNLDQDVAFEKTIKVYFDWIAKNDAVYHLGNSGDDVERLYYAQRDQLRSKPAGGKIGPAEWTDIFLQAGYYVSGWEKIATMFARWVQHHDAAAVKSLYDDTASGERRQRLRDLSRRPVHRHPVAAAVRPGARRERPGGAHGAVRDLGQRLVQRPLLHLEGARAHPGGDLRHGRAADPADQRDARRRHAVPGCAGGPSGVRPLRARRGPRRHDARGLAVRGGVHRRHDRRLPRDGRAARPGAGRPIGQAVPAGAAAHPEASRAVTA